MKSFRLFVAILWLTCVSSMSVSAAPAAGFYVPNTNTMDVYFAPAAELLPYAGQVLVGTELQGNFWLIRPTANGFATEQVAVQLPSGDLNLEGATYVP